MNIERARANMIIQQIKPWDVADRNILELLNAIHREDFIPAEFKSLAFADTTIPIGQNQFTMTPKEEARILQGLALKPTDRVLEIGTGCGYMSALLASSAHHVTSIDIYQEFTVAAMQKLATLNIDNVTLCTQNIFSEEKINDTFDVVVITGSIPKLDHLFRSYISPSGRMFAITGKAPVMNAQLLKYTCGKLHTQ